MNDDFLRFFVRVFLYVSCRLRVDFFKKKRTVHHVASGSPKTFQVDSILALSKVNNRYFGSLDGNQNLKSSGEKRKKIIYGLW